MVPRDAVCGVFLDTMRRRPGTLALEGAWSGVMR